MQTLLETLETYEDGGLTESHADYESVKRLAYECLRVLNIDENDLYEDVLKRAVHEQSLVDIVEDTPELRESLSIICELRTLYEQLRLMKLEGKVYDILDDFFNRQLDNTL